ncbi:MAG: hypothetical protein KGI33_02245 [Thaumarchaeota archaeon]|nr:hypothetical protein [Nitrososphaerota archaeon]
MPENPVRSLLDRLRSDLTEKEHTDQVLSDGKTRTFPIRAENFIEISGTINPKKIAFVDGGDGILEESPNYMIVINRLYFSIFRGKKRIMPQKLKRRIEFFSYVVSEIKKVGERQSISYNTNLFTYDDGDLEYLPDVADLTSKVEYSSILQGSKLVSLSRRFAEWNMACRIVENELSSGDVIVIDGSLQTSFENEVKYANRLYELATEKGVIVCGLTKTSRLVTQSGDPLLARIAEISERTDLPRWYIPVAEKVSSDDRGFMVVCKLHPKSRHVFRFEILLEQFNAMGEDERNNVLASLAVNAEDISMLGYPYGSIDADRFAQVRINELEMYRGMIMAEKSRDPQWKRLSKYTLTNVVHDDLNWVTS